MGFTIIHFFVSVCLLVAMNVIVEASFTKFDLFVLSKSTNYKDAVDLCKRYGMNLIKIEDEKTNQMVYEFAVHSKVGPYWIDASDMATEGTWVYSDGNRIVYEKWDREQPDNCNNEDCILGNNFPNGFWNDVNCDKQRTAICYAEKSIANNVTIEQSQLVALKQRVGFHTAVDLCKQRGMNLIKIQNEETNQAVFDYAVKNGLGGYWIDANDITTEGLWVYSNGNRIIYNKWGQGEPNNLAIENCAHGYFGNTTFWNDLNCYRSLEVICYSEKGINIVKENQLVLLEQKTDYHTAIILCQQYGMSLIQIQNEETDKIVYDYAVQRGIGDYWIDANDIKSEGSWVYNDGNPIIYNNWGQGEPDNMTNQICTSGLFFPSVYWKENICNENCVYASSNSKRFWKDIYCNRICAIICYKRSQPVERSTFSPMYYFG